MNLQEKLDASRDALHGTTVNFDHFLNNLAVFFGYGTKEAPSTVHLTDDDLQAATWEDLQDCGCPKGKARQIAKIFRGDASDGLKDKIVIVNDDPVVLAAKLKPTELVAKYDPQEPDNPFGVRLKALSNGQRFIVFNNDGTVNVPVSQTLLQELRDSYPERQNTVVNSEVHYTYAVGVRPSRYADEHPLFPGTILRPDYTSDADIDWKPISLSVRQLVYLAVKTGDLKGKDEQDVRDLIEGKTFNDLGKRWKNAALKFKELSETNQLPQLKIKLGVAGNGKQQNPFAVGNRVW